MYPQDVVVDQIVGDEAAREAGAAVGDDRLAVLP